MGFQQGLSGLNASAKNLDVIGHNIANANTTGFKASRTEFAAMVASAIGSAGGSNSGIGVEVSAIAQQFNQGNLTVTGLQTLNLSMQTMAEQFTTMQQIQGISLIGRSVLVEGNQMSFNAEKQGQGSFVLDGAASKVKVDIVTPGGVLVGSMDLGALEGGRQNFDWDASKYAGNPAELRFQVTATTGDKTIAAAPLMHSKVLATGSQNGALMLTLDSGATVKYADVGAVL